ncbi:sugar transferase [Winogradskyella sediminis]|uniref:sugar transferase n=1 Tax=Winogradskyella sediminis TaxID=1382466 RepID=UPI003AA8E375
MISKSQLRFKRIFDVVLVVLCLPLLFIPILLLVLIATIDTKTWGIYSQLRVGQYGQLFKIYKIRTLANGEHQLGQLHSHATYIGCFLRHSKLNELPQLYNVLIGDMSLVGPRPDLPGFADALKGEDRIILKVKPGITGPATIKYRDEEALLVQQKDPEHYNRTIIWPDKVKINKKYIENYSFYLDLTLILKSLIHK